MNWKRVLLVLVAAVLASAMVGPQPVAGQPTCNSNGFSPSSPTEGSVVTVYFSCQGASTIELWWGYGSIEGQDTVAGTATSYQITASSTGNLHVSITGYDSYSVPSGVLNIYVYVSNPNANSNSGGGNGGSGITGATDYTAYIIGAIIVGAIAIVAVVVASGRRNKHSTPSAPSSAVGPQGAAPHAPTVPPPALPSPAVTPLSAKLFCPTCGTVNDSKFCPNDGTPMKPMGGQAR